MPLDHFSGRENNERRDEAPRKGSGYAAEVTKAELTAIKQAEADDNWPPAVLDGMLDEELDALLGEDIDEAVFRDEPVDDDPASLDDIDALLEVEDFDDLDALLDTDNDEVEPSAVRLAALSDWIEVNFPDCKPIDQAAAICLRIEDENRLLDSDYRASVDPHIGAMLIAELGRDEARDEVEEKDNLVATSEAALSSETENIASQEAETTEKETEAVETEVERDKEASDRDEERKEVKSVTDLNVRHQALVKEHNGNQRGALEALRVEVENNPDFLEKIDSIIATLDRIEGSVPEADRPVVVRLLKASTLNLAGSGPLDVVGGFLSSIDASDEISDEAKTAIREAVLQEHTIHRGSEVKEAARQTRRDPETGQEVPVYTADNRREVRKGVSTYTETGDEVLVRLDLPGHPPVIRDVTGWSGDDVGLLTEAMGFSAALEQFGATAFVEDIYKIDFSLLGSSAFDRESLRSIRQSISAMVGTFEGYDGDIFDAESKIGLIRHQARLLNEEGTAYGTENSREATLGAARKLGIRNEDGVINFDVLKAFGAYAQETYLSGDASYAGLPARLYGDFPQFVEPPETESQLMAA